MNNFGDLLGPILVDRIVSELTDAREVPARHRLLTVGSIMRMARDGDTIWGTGVNGKSLDAHHGFTTLDVRAVRGPMTRDLLARRGIDAPAVYGDPGLLVGALWTRAELAQGHPHRDFVVVPNLHDKAAHSDERMFVDPQAPVWDVIGAIAASEYVVGSSLHAIVVAESLGVPARLIRSSQEPTFKYRDYYGGSGRDDVVIAGDLRDALRMGGAEPPSWNPADLLAHFPYDLWRSRGLSSTFR